MENWDAQKSLDLYILDYMKRKNMHTAAGTFAAEANVSTNEVALNPPEGFLTEWWDLFWDVYSKPSENRNAGEGSSSEAAKMAGNVPQNVGLTTPKPDVNDILQNFSPTIQTPRHPNLLEIGGSSMVPMQNMENAGPMGPRPEQNDEWVRVGPAIDYNFRLPGETMNMVGPRMNELERLRLSPANLNSNSHLLDQHQLACMRASSSKSSLPQTKVLNNRGLSVTRGECGTSLRRSIAAEPTETADTGRDRLGNQVPSVGFPSNAIRYVTPMSNQQQQFPATAPQVQHKSIFEAHTSKNMGSTNPVGGGSRENCLVAFGYGTSMSNQQQQFPVTAPQVQQKRKFEALESKNMGSTNHVGGGSRVNGLGVVGYGIPMLNQQQQFPTISPQVQQNSIFGALASMNMGGTNHVGGGSRGNGLVAFGYGTPMSNQQQQFPATTPQVQQKRKFEALTSNNMGSTNHVGGGSRENGLVAFGYGSLMSNQQQQFPATAPQVQQKNIFEAHTSKNMDNTNPVGGGSRENNLEVVGDGALLSNQQQQFPATAPQVQHESIIEAHASNNMDNTNLVGGGSRENGLVVVGDGTSMQDQQQQFPTSAPQVQQDSIFEAQTSKNMGSTIPVGDGSSKNGLVGGNNQEMEKPLDEEVDSFFSNEEVPDSSRTSKKGSNQVKKQGFSFELARSVRPTNNKFTCCDFSTSGDFLVAAGHEKKVFLWDLKKSSMNIIHGHSQLITDIRYKPNSTIFATSSFDRTLRIYDAVNPTMSYFRLVGHGEHVVSLDFNPGNPNLMCSCDSNDEIRLWNVFQNACLRTFKGANTRVRFQPQQGNLLAASTGNVINLIDVETGIIHHRFEGHDKDVHSLSWDAQGKYLVSVSEESARFWSVSCGGKSVHELHSTGNKFASGTFHPNNAVVALGSYQTIDIWNPALGSRTWSYQAHEGIVSCLANASETSTIASVSHDQWIKLWKSSIYTAEE